MSIDYTLDPLLWTPTKPIKLVDEPYYDVNIPQVIWIIGQPRCLPLDEYVYTSIGPKQVKEIYSGIPILGGYVKNAYYDEDEVYELLIGNNKFKASGNHPLWVSKSKGKDQKTYGGKWVTIKEIFDRYSTFKNHESRWRVYRYKQENFNFDTISVGKRFAKLLGYLMSDGYFTREQSVKFTNVNKVLINDVLDIILDLPQEYEISPKTYKKGNGLDLMLVREGNFKKGSPLKTKLRELGVIDRDTFGKILLLENEELIEFVKGFFNGDGWLGITHGTPKAFFFTGIHEKLAYEFQFILWRLGITGFIAYELRDPKFKGCWRIEVHKRKDVEKILDILEDIKYPKRFSDAKKLLKLMSKQSDHFEDEKGDWLPIDKIKSIGKQKVMGWDTEPSHEIIGINGLKTHNSGKGFAMDQFLEFDKEAGMTRIYIYSAGGHESLYLGVNKNCKKRWKFVMNVLKILVKSNFQPIPLAEIKSLLDFKESEKMFEKYIMLATDLKAITVEDDIVSITDTGKNIVKDEPLHCECYKPRKILVMLPPYVKPVQETVDRYNGWYWSGPEEYHEAYLKGKVDDFIPNQPWIDFTKILKPAKLRPEPIMVFRNITLPMNPGKTDTFRKEFRELMLECRQDDRDLVNSPSFFTNDHIGKLEKYTLVAEILKYLPELSQRDFAPLRLDKPRTEYTPKEKSWHKISVIANEVRALAPSNRLSAEPESSVSKRAWFGFLPERRHSKCWVKADMQSSEDFFVGSRNQNDLWVVKRITVALLGEAFQWLQDGIAEKRQRIFDYYKSDKGPALEAANKSWPMLSEIPDNKGYVIFGNREFKLIEINPPSWHHKSDVGDDFFADTQIEFIKDKQRVELEKSAKSEDSKKSKVDNQDKDEEMMLIHQMKTDGKKFPAIIEYFQKKAKDNNDMDSKWFKENKKKLSNRYNYWLDHRDSTKEKDHD